MANLDQIADYLADTALIETGTENVTSGTWAYRKWADGTAECWGQFNLPSATYAANNGYKQLTDNLPTGLFNVKPNFISASGAITGKAQSTVGYVSCNNEHAFQLYVINTDTSATTNTAFAFVHVIGTWK